MLTYYGSASRRRCSRCIRTMALHRRSSTQHSRKPTQQRLGTREPGERAVQSLQPSRSRDVPTLLRGRPQHSPKSPSCSGIPAFGSGRAARVPTGHPTGGIYDGFRICSLDNDDHEASALDNALTDYVTTRGQRFRKTAASVHTLPTSVQCPLGLLVIDVSVLVILVAALISTGQWRWILTVV